MVCILFMQRWLVPLRVHNQRGIAQRRLTGSHGLFRVCRTPGCGYRSETRTPLFLEASSPLPLPNPFSPPPKGGVGCGSGLWCWFCVMFA